MDALFCSVINVTSVNGFFKSLCILLPLFPQRVLHGICTQGKEKSERGKQRPQGVGSQALYLRDTPAQGNPCSEGGLTWRNLTGKPNLVASIRKSFLLEGVNMDVTVGHEITQHGHEALLR